MTMPNAKPKSHRTLDLAQIHLGKKQLGLEDDTYRTLLWTVARVRSAKDLDAAGRRAVIAHMVARGARLGYSGAARRNIPPAERKVRALWWALHQAGAVQDASDRALGAWVARQCDGVAVIAWLNDYQVQGLIESLKRWLARVNKRADAAH